MAAAQRIGRQVAQISAQAGEGRTGLETNDGRRKTKEAKAAR